jgi:hypothetical protein
MLLVLLNPQAFLAILNEMYWATAWETLATPGGELALNKPGIPLSIHVGCLLFRLLWVSWEHIVLQAAASEQPPDFNGSSLGLRVQ